MVAIDSVAELPASRPGQTEHTGQILLFAFLGSALLVVASLSLNIGSGDGWRIAAEMVMRFSFLLFCAAMLVEPLSRLGSRSLLLRAAGRERGGLMLAFAAAAAVSLSCVVAPSQLSVEGTAYCALTGTILVVMLFSAHPATQRFLGAPAWRAMQRIASAYFWLVFALTALEHLIGPHRPESWNGFALLLLVGVLLLRFADAFLAQLRGAHLAGKVA